jgi:hypothetical protein
VHALVVWAPPGTFLEASTVLNTAAALHRVLSLHDEYFQAPPSVLDDSFDGLRVGTVASVHSESGATAGDAESDGGQASLDDAPLARSSISDIYKTVSTATPPVPAATAAALPGPPPPNFDAGQLEPHIEMFGLESAPLLPMAHCDDVDSYPADAVEQLDLPDSGQLYTCISTTSPIAAALCHFQRNRLPPPLSPSSSASESLTSPPLPSPFCDADDSFCDRDMFSDPCGTTPRADCSSPPTVFAAGQVSTQPWEVCHGVRGTFAPEPWGMSLAGLAPASTSSGQEGLSCAELDTQMANIPSTEWKSDAVGEATNNKGAQAPPPEVSTILVIADLSDVGEGGKAQAEGSRPPEFPPVNEVPSSDSDLPEHIWRVERGATRVRQELRELCESAQRAELPRKPPWSSVPHSQHECGISPKGSSRGCLAPSLSFHAAAARTTTFERDASLFLKSAQLSSFNSTCPTRACMCSLEAPHTPHRISRAISARERGSSVSAPQLGVPSKQGDLPLRQASLGTSGGDGDAGVELSKSLKGRSVCLDSL